MPAGPNFANEQAEKLNIGFPRPGAEQAGACRRVLVVSVGGKHL